MNCAIGCAVGTGCRVPFGIGSRVGFVERGLRGRTVYLQGTVIGHHSNGFLVVDAFGWGTLLVNPEQAEDVR